MRRYMFVLNSYVLGDFVLVCVNVCYGIICDRCWMCCESLWLWLCVNVIYMVIGVICEHVGCVLNCGWICMCDNIWHNDVMCDVEMCEIVLNDVELMWICVYMYVCLVWPLSWEVYDDLLNCGVIELFEMKCCFTNWWFEIELFWDEV